MTLLRVGFADSIIGSGALAKISMTPLRVLVFYMRFSADILYHNAHL